MKRNNSRIGVELSDENARVCFFVDGYRPNGYSAFGEIDNSDILDGGFGYNLYDSDEWGAGEFSIWVESVHRIADQLRSFIRSDQTEVQIDEEIRINIARNGKLFVLSLSMNDQLTGDYITVKKELTYHELYQSLLRPMYTISKKYP